VYGGKVKEFKHKTLYLAQQARAAPMQLPICCDVAMVTSVSSRAAARSKSTI